MILFPDIEAHLVAYLRDALAARPEPYCAGVIVDIDERNPRPARAVAVRRDGGARLDVLRDGPRVSFRVWAETDADATDLANMVRALAVEAANGRPIVRTVEQSGPTPIPDEAGPLRLVVVEFIVRGAAA